MTIGTLVGVCSLLAIYIAGVWVNLDIGFAYHFMKKEWKDYTLPKNMLQRHSLTSRQQRKLFTIALVSLPLIALFIIDVIRIGIRDDLRSRRSEKINAQ